VQPRESEWFGFYTAGQDKKITPMEQSQIYINDTIGLKTLNNGNRLQQLQCIGNHLQFTNQYFISTVINPYLNYTFSSLSPSPYPSASSLSFTPPKLNGQTVTKLNHEGLSLKGLKNFLFTDEVVVKSGHLYLPALGSVRQDD